MSVDTGLLDRMTDAERARLASRLLAETAGSQPEPPQLVRLAHGTASPWFCIHPVSGDVTSYAALCLAIDWSRGMLAVQAQGLDGRAAPRDSLADMAEHYALQIAAAQPEGRLLLGGWSMGGLVAYETALALARLGRVVDGLVLIDSALPGAARDFTMTSRELLALFVRDLWGRHGLDGESVLADLTVDAQPDALAALCTRARQHGVIHGAAEERQLRYLYAACLAHYRAMATHEATGSYPGAVLLLQAAEPGADRNAAALARWTAFCTGPITVHQLPGDHHSLLRQPHVRLLGERLADWDRQRNRHSSST
ncbi:thioesterase domain-containing protein [Chitinolyticbacter albus]|uniref:thioesterase domain-containing protein n=1 Tax=Chitinolyticbacter albus TaxID=2961951 RepID=UPI00210E79CD|nr:alpha/beta fold hydrolase [Chitinolyticbacter albus]